GLEKQSFNHTAIRMDLLDIPGPLGEPDPVIESPANLPRHVQLGGQIASLVVDSLSRYIRSDQYRKKEEYERRSHCGYSSIRSKTVIDGKTSRELQGKK